MIEGVVVKKRRLKIKAEKTVDENGTVWYVLKNEYGQVMFGGYKFLMRSGAYRKFREAYPENVWKTRCLRHGGYSIDISEVK